jgi:integrase
MFINKKIKKNIAILKNSIGVENSIYHYEKQFLNYLSKLEKINNCDFLDFLVKKRLQDVSLSRLNRYIVTYFKYLDIYNIKKINSDDVEAIFLKIKLNQELKDTTKQNEWIIIKQILRFYRLKNLFLEDFKLRCKKKELLYDDLLTDEEKEEILNSNINLEKKVFFSIMFDTGLRVGELFSTDINSFRKDEKGYWLQIQKSKTEIRPVFAYSHINWIDELLGSGWSSWTFSYSMTRKVLTRWKKKFGKRVYNHLARHTKATKLYNAGVPLKSLEYYFGWKSPKMLLTTYAHVKNEKALQDVLNVELK